MRDLIERLERAESGSFELDLAIFRAVDARADISDYELCSGNVPLPHYSRTIDAALTLVPDGWTWLVRTDKERGAFANIFPAGTSPNRGDPCWEAYGANGALALVIAALKAREADRG